MSMNPPHEIYLKPRTEHQTYCESRVHSLFRLMGRTRRLSPLWQVLKELRVLEFQKPLHLLQCLVQCPLKGAAAWPQTGEAQLVLQPSIDHLQIGPAQHLLAP
jgi:hypothetical protein